MGAENVLHPPRRRRKLKTEVIIVRVPPDLLEKFRDVSIEKGYKNLSQSIRALMESFVDTHRSDPRK